MEVTESSAPVPTASAGRGSRRWLLLYNCQAQGLTNCLGLLGHDLQVDCHEVPTVQANAAAVSRTLGDYERVLVLPQVRTIPGFEAAGHPQVRDLPSFVFSGYHPDLFRLGDDSGLRQGPLGNFHSLLAYCGWRMGRDVAATVAMFRATVFEAAGYFDGWSSEREALLGRFSMHGLELRSEFHAWCRRGPFMHNPIHPTMLPLRDLARLLLDEAGVQCRDTQLLPHDNLAAGPVFPVYPGLASRLGVPGSFDFKRSGRYEAFGLPEFVERSFSAFDRFAGVGPVSSDDARVSAVLARVGDHA